MFWEMSLKRLRPCYQGACNSDESALFYKWHGQSLHTQKIIIVSFQFRKYSLEFKYTDQDGILKLRIFYIIFLFISQNVSMNVLRVKAF